MFLCRVAVGDWSKGTNGQLTPDPKPDNKLELFDSTTDNVGNPSIFVVYNDAQAYPEYLVSFKQPTSRF
jgi:poly [ADP-ribose] polymerase 10/14/15